MKKPFTSADIKTEHGRLLLSAFRLMQGGKCWNKNGEYVAFNAEGEACYCALGAVMTVDPTQSVEVRDHLYAVVRSCYRRRVPAVPLVSGFNDAPTTTWADMRRLFGRAILHAEGRFKFETKHVAKLLTKEHTK